MFTSQSRSLKSIFGALIVIGVSVLGASGATVVPASAVTTPDIPTNIVVIPGDEGVSISLSPNSGTEWWELEYRWLRPDGAWAANGWDGAISDGDYDSFGPDDGPYYRPALPYVISGLTNGTEYRLKVRRGDGSGPYIYSDWSEWVRFTPTAAATPAAPTSLVATAGDGQVSIAFTAGSSNGSAITGYEYSINDGSTWVAASPAITASPLVITGLTNGTEYSLKLRALNAIGNGVASEPVVFKPTAPVVVTTTTTTIAPVVVTTTTTTNTPVSVGANTTTVATPTTVNTTPPPKEEVVLDLPTPTKPLITDTELVPGAPVTLTFGGFVPGEFVQLIVASTPRVIASGYADSKGFITLSGDIPASLASGNHSLALFAPVSGIGIRQPITVVKAVKTLPQTGSSTQSNVPVSAAVLMVGVLFVAYARRRNSTEQTR